MLHSLWILAATFFTVLTYVFVKWVPPQYEIWDIFFVRSCYMAFFAVLMAAVAKTPLKTKIPKAHIGRAICGMLALLITYSICRSARLRRSFTPCRFSFRSL